MNMQFDSKLWILHVRSATVLTFAVGITVVAVVTLVALPPAVVIRAVALAADGVADRSS